MESAFGAAGSLVLLLLWIYYSCVVFLFGAEITQAYAQAHGAGIEPEAYAQWLAAGRGGDGDRDRSPS